MGGGRGVVWRSHDPLPDIERGQVKGRGYARLGEGWVEGVEGEGGRLRGWREREVG